MIACVSSSRRRRSSESDSEGVPPVSSKVVDMDLCSFLPTWFWRFTCCYPYSVVAAANGLVCISNSLVCISNSNGADDNRDEEEHTPDCCHHQLQGLPAARGAEPQPEPAPAPAAAATGNQRYHYAVLYAVLNPLTRTCTVLPPVPFTPRRGCRPPRPAPSPSWAT